MIKTAPVLLETDSNPALRRLAEVFEETDTLEMDKLEWSAHKNAKLGEHYVHNRFNRKVVLMLGKKRWVNNLVSLSVLAVCVCGLVFAITFLLILAFSQHVVNGVAGSFMSSALVCATAFAVLVYLEWLSHRPVARWMVADYNPRDKTVPDYIHQKAAQLLKAEPAIRIKVENFVVREVIDPGIFAEYCGETKYFGAWDEKGFPIA